MWNNDNRKAMLVQFQHKRNRKLILLGLLLLVGRFPSSSWGRDEIIKNCGTKSIQMFILAADHSAEADRITNIEDKKRIISELNPKGRQMTLALEGVVRGSENTLGEDSQRALRVGLGLTRIDTIIGIEEEIPHKLPFLLKNIAAYKMFWDGIREAARHLPPKEKASRQVWLSALTDRSIESKIKKNIQSSVNDVNYFKQVAIQSDSYSQLNSYLSTSFLEEQTFSESVEKFLSSLFEGLEKLRYTDDSIKIMPPLKIAREAIWAYPGDNERYERYFDAFGNQWRTRIFAKNLSKYICESEDSTFRIFVVVGAKHAEGILSELTNIFGDKIQIKIVPVIL